MDFIHELRWRPGIGDPTIMGWLTVAFYAIAAIAAFLAARRAGQNRWMWWAVTALMSALCLNKQLDLQSLATDIGRVFAWHQGWYQERREFQKWFVLGILAASFLGTGLLVFLFRGFWKNHFLLASGLVFLLTFIVVRAVSFHHVDVLLRHEVAGVRMNWFLELTGIGLVLLAAIRDWRKPRTVSAPAAK